MHYQCIALILIVLLAVPVNAATNIVPAYNAPAVMPDQNNAFRQCYFATAAPKCARRRCK